MLDARQEANDSEHDKKNNLQFFVDLRTKTEIQVTLEKSITFQDFLTSLNLDPDLFEAKKSKEVKLDDYIHFFKIEQKTNLNEIDKVHWSIRRRSSDFFKFEKKVNEELIGKAKMSKSDIPQLSSLFDKNQESSPEKFSKAAETYLKNLLESPEIRSKGTVLYEFIELSLLPLPTAQQKYKEGYLKKKGGGRFKHNKAKLYLSFLAAKCQERWFILTQDGILYANDATCLKAREILFFDQSFKVEYGKKATGHDNGISLVTPNRRLNLLANDIFEAADWVAEIQKLAKASPYTKSHRFSSFAPEREAVHNCKWYVDAVGYYEDLYEALISAKREVFITDWMLTPEIALKKPVQDGESEYRLDKVLAKIANAGVKVYVIVYHEVRLLMYNDSGHAKVTLESLSPNITVLRHPSEPFFSWSHHEKMVVVDQTIGFIGGLDLCFGRWDTSDHPLYDPAFEEGTGVTYFGQDYANPRRVNWKNVRELPHVSLINKKTTPRMPFHDAMVRVIGPAVADMSRHFIQFWNHVEVDVYDKENDIPLPKRLIVPALEESTSRKENMFSQMKNALKGLVQGKESSQSTDGMTSDDKKSIIQNEPQLIMSARSSSEGLEQNEREKSLSKEKSDMVSEEQKSSQRVNTKESQKVNDGRFASIKNAFYNAKSSAISVINNVRRKQVQDPEELSHPEKDQTNNHQHNPHTNNHTETLSRNKGVQKKRDVLRPSSYSDKDQQTGTIACQMLRSASQWSLGLNREDNVVENSILQAFIQTIQNAKHFVYMESQFFMSSTAGEALKNDISEALIYRIECAHARQQRFRVLIFLPLIHAFEGDITDPKSGIIRIQLHWQFMTISRGGNSIYEVLRRKGINPEEYIQFYSVRQHHKMANGDPETEIIYIHSKILVADDDVLVIGSANMNDRSMIGSRDSEIAMCFNDSKKVTSHMNGVEVQVSEFVHTFRKRLLAEHLGLSEDEVADPLSDSFIKTMNSRAQRNTEIYREVFAVDPDDNMRTLKGVKELRERRKLERYDELAPQIKGHVVMYPLDFLCDEELLPPKTAVEHYVSHETFV